nr:hypothetical protein CFP56_08163 [Quercus suber]
MSKRWSNLLQSDAEFTISSIGQICACSIKVAFETSTTKNLFGKCCYLYISLTICLNVLRRAITLDDDSTKLAIGLITPFSIKRSISRLQQFWKRNEDI